MFLVPHEENESIRVLVLKSGVIDLFYLGRCFHKLNIQDLEEGRVRRTLAAISRRIHRVFGMFSLQLLWICSSRYPESLENLWCKNLVYKELRVS